MPLAHLRLTANGLPAGWPSHSSPNPDELPKYLLSTKELQFVVALMPNEYGGRQPLYDKEGIIGLLRASWGELWEGLSDASLLKNLTSGKKYCDREYYEGGKLISSVRPFRKGLLQKFPMPKKGVRFEYWYGYPRETFRLGKKNFAAKYPPHDAFGGWCVRRIREGITGSINQLPREYRKLAHFDGSGDYVADQSYRIEIDGKKSYWWVEIHTGSEGYGWEKFLKRIVTAEERLKDRGKFLVIV
ncbi:MAG: hypothetical protein GF308_04230, partial [Candidatus Heimdallarchaeota archaeon]|nr:hypothetical protein [Candidatus Heimdallarchaeota archaeon]